MKIEFNPANFEMNLNFATNCSANFFTAFLKVGGNLKSWRQF